MSRPLLFEASTLIVAPARTLYDFHQNPHNLRVVCPPWMEILAIEAEPTARPGGEFFVRLRQFGIPVEWHGRWETVEPPRLLVDTGVRCPFRGWCHEHRFEEQGPAACRLTDRVRLEPPMGMLGAPFAWLALAAMFRSRHRATRKYFCRQGHAA